MNTVLEVNGLSVDYLVDPVVHAVRDLSLALHRGEVLGLAGESGCGKSTLAYGIAARRDRVSIVFQGALNSLNPVISVRAQLEDVFTTQRPALRRRERHDLSLLLEISDRIAVMRDGAIVEMRDAADLYANPRPPTRVVPVADRGTEAAAMSTPEVRGLTKAYRLRNGWRTSVLRAVADVSFHAAGREDAGAGRAAPDPARRLRS